jgi:hypothetical protein
MTIVIVAALLAPGMVRAIAAPVCSDVPEAACGFRIFAEPTNSATFLQYDNHEYENGIKALAERFPRFVKVSSLDVLLGDPTAVSVGGRKLWVIEVTDFNVPEEGKLPVVVSCGVHANEPAGREGATRYAEDLARWATDEPTHVLRNGTEADSTSFTVSEALSRVHLYISPINPDGWAAGDLENGGVYDRGNGNGVDLNREFVTIGWTKPSHTPLSEPESFAWDRFVKSIDPVTTVDLHGELTSNNNSYADIMLPAGQWDPLFQAQEESFARHMRSNIDRYFRDKTIALGQADQVPLQPAEFATGYDVVGYDDSGFMGDFFTQNGAIDLDIEHLLSHTVPNSIFIQAHETLHVAAVRAEIETAIVEALVTDAIRVSFDLGSVGYLFDPRVVTDSDSDGYGDKAPPEELVSYEATPMRYFEDLGTYTTEPLRKVPSGEVNTSAAPGLDGLDSFVVTTWPPPPDPQGLTVDKASIVQRIRSFVENGGNLILTDEGLKVLEDLGLAAGGSVTKTLWQAGHVDIANFTDAYTAHLNSTASQTYYEVALGYSANGQSDRQSPHWSVPQAAWEAAGGVTLGTIDSGRTGLGRIHLGQGSIGIIGALLPPPTEKFDHWFGLADYALTVTGGQILNNMLAAA